MPTIWDVSPPCDGAKMMDDQIPPFSPCSLRWKRVVGGVVLCGMVSGRSLEGRGGRGENTHTKKKSLADDRNAVRVHYGDINEAAGLVH